MVSLALHEPYVLGGHIQNLSGPHVARGLQISPLLTYDNELDRNQSSRRKLDAQILGNKLTLKTGLTD